MRHRHQVSITTHTVEMAQIAEINNGLRERESAYAIRASLLGMQGVKLSPGNDDNDDNTLPRSSPLQQCLVDPDLFAVLGDNNAPAGRCPDLVCERSRGLRLAMDDVDGLWSCR